jgi:cytochrome c
VTGGTARWRCLIGCARLPTRAARSSWLTHETCEIKDEGNDIRIFVFSLLIGGAAGSTALAGAASAQDVAAGEKTFNVCRACHEIGDGAKNLVGPVLNGVVGRKSGSYPGYAYSYANKNSGITWDEPTLTEYLKNPRAVVPGAKVLFSGSQEKTMTSST